MTNKILDSIISESTPVYRFTIPSLQQEYEYKPFTVADEHSLLIAKESGNHKNYISTVKKVIENCILDKSLNVNDLKLWDISYLIVKIRSQSVGEIVSIELECDCDSKVKNKVNINLDNIKVDDKEVIKSVSLGENITLNFKAPDFQLLEFIINHNKDINTDDSIKNIKYKKDVVIGCIESVTQGDEVVIFSEVSYDDKLNFIDSLSQANFMKLQAFFDNIPSVYYDLKYKCSKCEKEIESKFEGFNDFFI